MTWKGWTVLIVAIWLIVAAIIAAFIGTAPASTAANNSATSTAVQQVYGGKLFNLTNFLIVGIIFAAIGIFMFTGSKAAAWIVLLSGIWLIIAAFIPSITGSKAGAVTNGLIFGVLVAIFSFFDKKQA